jgi:hypothetical protein
MPPAPPLLPLAADVREVSGRWSVCRDATCKPVGHRLAAALGRAAAGRQPVDADGLTVSSRSATLDLRAVVLDDALWNVAADRTVTLKRPTTKPWGPERSLTVVGDIVLVQWGGDCTDMLCLTSRAVDARGLELAWVRRSPGERDADLLRIDDDRYLVFGPLVGVSMYDLHTNKSLGTLDQPANEDAIAIAALGTTRYAEMRRTAAGVAITTIDVAGGHLAATDRETTVPACEP